MPRHQVSMTIMMVNRDRAYIIYNIMLRELLTMVYIWRCWGFRHEWTSRVPRAMGFQPKLPVPGPPSQYLFCFLPNTFCSNEERAELWLRLWNSAPEKGRRKSGSLSSPRSHTYPLLYLLCWEAEPNTLTKTKTHFLLTLGLRVKNRNSYSPIIYAK